MTLRQFSRALKVADLNSDDDLLKFMRLYAKDSKKKTGIRMLQEYTISHIKGDSSFKTLTELFGVINTVIQPLVNWTLSKDLFYKLRLAVADKYGKDSPQYETTYRKMKIPKAVYDENRKDYAQSVVSKNRDKKQFSGATIKDILLKLSRATDSIDNLVLLQLASGARIGELIYASEFKKSRIKNSIKQSGLLKTKIENLTVDKPILFMTNTAWLALFNITRKELTTAGDANKEGGVRLNHRINTRVKQMFNNDDLHSHDLRRMYADIAYKMFADTNKISECAYVAQLLGHDPDDITTAKSYTTLNVNNTDLLKGHFVESGDVEAVEIPLNPKKRDGRVFEYLEKTIDAMRKNDIRVTERNLKKYGYGSNTYKAWLMKQEK